MKIALPVNGQSIDAGIHDSFGRAPYYLIFNSTSGKIDFLDHRAVVACGCPWRVWNQSSSSSSRSRNKNNYYASVR